jgi:PAS domain S-box-containing protein
VPSRSSRLRPAPPPWLAFALSCALLLLLTSLKLTFRDHIGVGTPFLLYFITILLAAWFGGAISGALVTVLAALLGTYFFVPPFHSFVINDNATRARLMVFLFEGACLTYAAVLARTAQGRARAAGDEARLSLAKLEGLLGAVDDGITVQDPQGKLVYANDPGARLCGYPNAAALLAAPLGEIMSRFELLTPDGKPFPIEDLPGRRVLLGQEAPERLMRVRMRDTGEERHSLVRARPVRLPGGDVSFAVNVFHDVTEMRRRDDELLTSREWFATALRSIGDAVIATDELGRVTFLNPIAEQLTGWSNADAAQRTLPEVFHILDEERRLPVESPVARVLREGGVVGLANHTVLISRAGNELAIDDSAAPIRTAAGELVGTVLVFRDVSRKRTEERQRALLARATQELTSSLDYNLTLATVARMAVPAIADWCAVDILDDGQLRRLAVEHVDPSKVDLVFEIERRYPRDPARPGPREAVLATGQPIMVADIPDADIVAAARDEEHAALLRRLSLRSFIVVPLKAHGGVVGILTLATAESNRRFEDDDLAMALALADRASLAVANARLYADAQRARELAEQASRSKDEFLAMLGHELRNPLAPILTALQLMKLRQATVFEKERAIIERQVRHVVTLVDDLLDISRITRGKIEIARERVDLADTLGKALELAGPILEERQHQVSVAVPRGLIVQGDPVRLAQVLTNLLTNSAKYTNPRGHIEVTATRLSDGPGPGEILLTVRDNGVGIEADLLPRVFHLFVQGQQALDRSKGGLGLGLAIVRTVVELHGGRVSAHSEGLGKGSEFRVTFPALGAAAQPAVAAGVNGGVLAAAPGAARVLVVDDNPDALELLTEVLRLKGHEVHGALDAASALQLAAGRPPDVALLDIGLPVIDGYELARRLRAMPGMEALKLAALTGYGQPNDKERARAAGFDEHLVKPISLEQVEAVLERLLGR